ncbi:MAG: putative cell adhesion protein, partial [Parcubacteria bacterium C7867-004]
MITIRMPRITPSFTQIGIFTVGAFIGALVIYGGFTSVVQAQAGGTYELIMTFPESGVDSDENFGETFAPCRSTGNCSFSCNAGNVGRTCSNMICAGGSGDSAFFYTHEYACVYTPPPYSEGYYAPTYSQGTYYSQGYYQGTYYSEGYYAPTYSQGYYQGTYYSEGYYAPTYSQGYYQSYYQGTYYSQGYYQGTYYSEGYYAPVYTEGYYAPGYSQGAYEASYSTPPDLTAAYVSPSSGTEGSITLRGRATNQGTTASGSFTSYFEVQGSASLSWTSSISLAGGANQEVTASRGFTAGTYQVRLCVDGAGGVTESNESNNCSSWASLTISPAAGPPSGGTFPTLTL